MALFLDEDQRLLRESTKAFVAEHAPVSALRRLRDERDPDGFDRAVWRSMSELGWAGVLVPEGYGGIGYGLKGLGVVLEETGRTLTASPLLSTALVGASLIDTLGTPEQKARWLPGLARGELITALALDEGPRHAPERIEAEVRMDDAGLVLDGDKTFVLDGHVADLLLVAVRGPREGGGTSVLVVTPDTPGVAVTRTLVVDSRNAADVRLRGVQVGAEAVLGGSERLGGAGELLDHVLDLARIGLAAEMLGGACEAFERTLAYLKTREQFGVPIGSFQALKHRAALMFAELELARSAVMAGLEAVEEDAGAVPLLASLAKARLSDTFHLVSSEAIQMHGGIGMTDEEEIGLFLKRARVAEQTFGDARFHRDRYARLSGF